MEIINFPKNLKKKETVEFPLEIIYFQRKIVYFQWKCEFSMKKVEDGFELNGHINALIEIECVRCLEKKSISVLPPININIKNEKKHAFKKNNNEVVYLPNTKKDIDLNPILADIIELSKPMNPICKKQCRGLCEICGINKNVISCYCTDLKDTSIWNKLKKLRS